MGYEYYSLQFLHGPYYEPICCFFFRCLLFFFWLASMCFGVVLTCAHFYVRKKKEKKREAVLAIFFSFHYTLRMKFILEIVSMIKHDHFILLNFFVFSGSLLLILILWNTLGCVIATDVLHVANNFLVTFACLLFQKWSNDSKETKKKPFCWYFKISRSNICVLRLTFWSLNEFA